MLLPTLKLAPDTTFWCAAACGLVTAFPKLSPAAAPPNEPVTDLSGVRVVVPTFAHGHLLRAALGDLLGRNFVPPRICTMASWLDLQQPDDDARVTAATGNERVMLLYAALRQHAWLKKLFGTRRNTDLLPLSQTLLALSDELTAAMLPALESQPTDVEDRWEAALAQLPPSARSVLSEEAQLVWTVWKTQLDAADPGALNFARIMRLAAEANTPLVWIAPAEPDTCTSAFLQAWGTRAQVLPILLDWRVAALPATFAQAWPEIVAAEDTDGRTDGVAVAMLSAEGDLYANAATVATEPVLREVPACTRGLALSPASSLEDEAQRGAQTVVDWLAEGKCAIAVVAQDRVVARRIRALLQRAQVMVADETGWKLSTTRAAAALAAWFDVVSSRAESTVLLDFLKSPFLVAGTQCDDQADLVMMIELALRRANVTGGWKAVVAAVASGPARAWLQQLSDHAGAFRGRRTIDQWLAQTDAALAALGIATAWAEDVAGVQMLAMLTAIGSDCGTVAQDFSFAEWRAYVGMQMEAASFMAPMLDRRVVMLPLNGTHLRSFDAVLVVGADATHLPSVSAETLFFANAVRRELGLATRESRQLQQLRDFTELLAFNSTVVLSWQAHRDGEPNPVSHWISRLALILARANAPALRLQAAGLATRRLQTNTPQMPAPAAPGALPDKLSASGYASLVACPYQFFATRMLGLSGLDELSVQLEKRDYGDWLHQILHTYHVGLREQAIPHAARAYFLQAVTQEVFDLALAKSAAALGYFDRWQKAMPAYLAWAEARDAAGWTFVTGEEWRQQPLRWGAGEILLQGRVDRIDCNAEGEFAVLDYKTSNLPALKKRLTENEDHQLAFYGLLLTSPSAPAPSGASYVALEPTRDRIDTVAVDDYAATTALLQRQLVGTMQAIAEGATLRASGIASVCQYCDVRGLCRKGAW
ncbi:MAG: PD-(D/E)XK nuclease family protein [Herminiimonas sp.]|nr:PD-(D/E)XK nuclease family protein [Herminiimonas sp.]